MRVADLSVYCLALPSLNKIETCVHTDIHKLRKVKRSSFGYNCLREVNISGTTRKCRLPTRVYHCRYKSANVKLKNYHKLYTGHEFMRGKMGVHLLAQTQMVLS